MDMSDSTCGNQVIGDLHQMQEQECVDYNCCSEVCLRVRVSVPVHMRVSVHVPVPVPVTRERVRVNA